jgi:hypothetical protein
MVKNHKLAKSIRDAGWDQFTQWLQYFGKIYGKTVIAVALNTLPKIVQPVAISSKNRYQLEPIFVVVARY